MNTNTIPSSSSLKKIARESMVDAYGSLAACALVYLLISVICSFLPAMLFPAVNGFNTIIQYLVSFLLTVMTSMLGAGFGWISLSCLRDQRFQVGDLLYAFFHQADRFLILYLILNGVSMVISLPSLLFDSYLTKVLDIEGSPGIGTMLAYSFLSMTVLLLLSFVGTLVLLRFSMAVYLLLDVPEMSAREALRESARLMKGHCLRYLWLLISFAGIHLLGYFSCGVGYLWALPYMEITYAAFFLKLRGESAVAEKF